MNPTIGRIVHYVLKQGPSAGEHRPAMIVRVWEYTLVNLQVFTDSDANGRYNDSPTSWSGRTVNSGPVQWAPNVVQDELEKRPGTWHWPERDE